MAKSKPKNTKKSAKAKNRASRRTARPNKKHALNRHMKHPKRPKAIAHKINKAMVHSQKEHATHLKQKDKPKEKIRSNVSISNPEEVKASLDKLLLNMHAVEYLKKNVSKMAVDVIGMLVTPKTDEFIAEQLGMKINAIRRILNIMQGYGITNYYISKNTKGWLSFAWYINTSKLPPFLEYVNSIEKEKSVVTDTCNDYFVCESCYKNDRFVFTFDSAFENNFKCNGCGKNLNRMNREEAQLLINKANGT